MKVHTRLDRRKIVMICALAVTLVLGTQLLAVTAWTADAANQGPGIVIVQLSDDPVSDWTVNDLLGRLSTFVTDDLFFPDRVTLEKTSDPYVVKRLGGQIIIYVTHGGQSGIITGRQVTPWEVLADIVMGSSAKVHLFTACFSKEMVKFGDSESGKIVYTVPGRQPAEVTNVEVISTVKLALGFTSEEVEAYRTEELTRAKELVTSGQNVHMMDFEQVILSEIDAIDGQSLLLLQITLDLLGTLGIISSDLAIAGVNPDDSVMVERIGALAERALINTGPIGLMLNWSWMQLQLASIICINWGLFPIFLISLAQYNLCLLAMLLALYHNFHGTASVGDACTVIFSIVISWVTFGLSIALRNSVLRTKILNILERVFGQSNPSVGPWVKWCTYISILFWVVFIFFEVASLIASQPMDATFYAPSWAQ